MSSARRRSRSEALFGAVRGLGLTPWSAAAVAGASSLVLVADVAVAGVAVLAVLVAAAADGWQVRRPPAVERTVPAVVSRGIPAPFRVAAHQRGARRVSVRQALPPDVTADLRGGGRGADGVCEGTVTALRRGVHRFSPVAVRSDGPLGLGRWYHRVGGTERVEAHADLPTAHRLALAVRRGTLRPTGERTRGPLGLGTEFESLRDYHPDDDSRLINWRATSRLGRPMSNNLRVEQDQTMVIALDCGRLQSSSLGTATSAPPGAVDGGSARGLFAVPPWAATRLDSLNDVVSALSMVADELGDRCGLVAYDDAIRADVRPARRGSAGVLRAALEIDASTADTDHAKGLAVAAAFRPTVLLVCADATDPVSVEPLVAGLSGIASQRRVVVIFPDDLGAELEPVTEPGVLAQYRAERGAALALVRSTGARVVHAPPHRLAEAAVRTYLGARG
jgi:uncharacterized protein (DUF58 family)